MRRAFICLGLFALAGCVETGGPQLLTTSVSILPDFGAYAAFTTNADRLVIVIERGDSTSGFDTLVRDTVDIDPASGEATAEFTLTLLSSPEAFRITLQAIRASTGAVVFQGVTIAQVSNSGGTANVVTVPVVYVGVLPATVTISPNDTSLTDGSSYSLVATARDAQGAVLADVPITFEFVDAADSNVIELGRLTGSVTIPAGTPNQEIFMYARTPNERRDTTRLFVGATPAGVDVAPGFGNVAVGGTLQLTGTVVDGGGSPIAYSGGFTFASRDPSVATVNGNGLVTGTAAGSAVIVVDALGFTDSMAVNVVTSGTVPVSAMGAGNAFAEVANGSTITVDIVVDMAFTSGEALGSYNATYTWDPAEFQFVGITGADMPNPVVNTNNTGAGEVRFANADAGGQLTGQVTIAQIQLRALTTGTFQPVLAITELSAAVTFTDLLSNVTVVQGDITVR